MYFTVFIPLSWSSFTFISSIKIEKKIGHKCAKDYVPFALTDTTDIASLHHCSLEYFIESFYTLNYLTVDGRISNTKYDTIHTEHEHDTK